MKIPFPCMMLFIMLSLLIVEGEVSVVPAPAPTPESCICNVMELVPCANAYTTSTPPSPQCCERLKEQQPCICQYMNDPTIRTLINTPNAKMVSDFCGSPMPNNC
ncbi:hypothetical protein VNO78_21614 [Psophocarpus tetragonolobus]|uniref:Bifunctional inhibitor/plant lipid transfer protein/seed storage helical domain-containing protein n=1 Tax=Psophocarpus tetragonolobus TaxID=3891 RepID=A0AAN9SDK8_PSOTE